MPLEALFSTLWRFIWLKGETDQTFVGRNFAQDQQHVQCEVALGIGEMKVKVKVKGDQTIVGRNSAQDQRKA